MSYKYELILIGGKKRGQKNTDSIGCRHCLRQCIIIIIFEILREHEGGGDSMESDKLGIHLCFFHLFFLEVVELGEGK